MARPLRIQYPGAIYHVMDRGNARQPILSNNADRRSFFEILAEVIEQRRWLCHAYCLMNNHYHLLLETPAADLSRGMRQLNGVYTQRYNRRHHRVGHLFQGRFKAVLVQRDVHLLELTRYIVLNPVVAGLVKRPERYPWSSYRAAAGFRGSPAWLTCGWVLSQFGANPSEQCAGYRSFVLKGIAERNCQWSGGPIVGDDQFVEKHRRYLEAQRAVREIPRRERFADRPSLYTLLRDSIEAPRNVRNRSVRRVHKEYAYSAAEIGRLLGLHPSTISKIVNGPHRD
jgi:REP element-mobilizing transposase RayT